MPEDYVMAPIVCCIGLNFIGCRQSNCLTIIHIHSLTHSITSALTHSFIHSVIHSCKLRRQFVYFSFSLFFFKFIYLLNACVVAVIAQKNSLFVFTFHKKKKLHKIQIFISKLKDEDRKSCLYVCYVVCIFIFNNLLLFFYVIFYVDF